MNTSAELAAHIAGVLVGDPALNVVSLIHDGAQLTIDLANGDTYVVTVLKVQRLPDEVT